MSDDADIRSRSGGFDKAGKWHDDEDENAPARTYLAVPYEDRNQVKSLGGRWDREAKAWYVPHGANSEPFRQWALLDGLFLFNPGDELHANAIGRVGPEPAEQHGGAVAGADQQQEKGRAPEPPSRRTLQPHEAEINHCALSTDRCEAPPMPVAERRRRWRIVETRAQDPRDIGARLLGRRREAGRWPAPPCDHGGRVADGEDLRMSGNRQVGSDLQAP